MTTQVLSTVEAKTAIDNIQSILSNGLENTIQQLNTNGQTLSDPGVWNGNLAVDFRENVWPACHTALNNAYTQLSELQTKLNTIHSNIFAAGGNG